MSGSGGRLFMVGLLGLLVALGCDDCPTGSTPTGNPRGGVISGRIYAGGEPLAARVCAVRISGIEGSGEVCTRTDEQGAFSLDCPAGDYYVKINCEAGRYYYTREGAVVQSSEKEVFTLGSSQENLDVVVELARLELSVNLIPSERHRRMHVTMHSVGADGLLGGEGMQRSVSLGELGAYHLEMAGLQTGCWQIGVELEGDTFSEYFWAPGTRDPEEAHRVQVASDAPTQYSFFLHDPLAEVTGAVTGSWQAFDWDEPFVELFTADSAWVGGCRPSADGYFAMPLKLAEPFKAKVKIGAIEQWIGGVGFDSATLFEPVPGETVAGVSLAECGLVLEIADPPLATFKDMRIDIFEAGHPSVLLHSVAASRNMGFRTALSNLLPGIYLVRLSNPRLRGNWASQWIDRQSGPDVAQLIPIDQPGDIAIVPVTMIAGGSISGTVHWDGEDTIPAGGGILYKVDLLLADAATGVTLGERQFVAHRTQPETKDFVFRGIGSGDFKLGAHIASWSSSVSPDSTYEATVWYPAAVDWDSAAVFVVSGGSLEDVEFSFP